MSDKNALGQFIDDILAPSSGNFGPLGNQGYPTRELLKSLFRKIIPPGPAKTPSPEDLVLNFMGELRPLYHGSPYTFNKFSNAHIGSGEGSSSFGWGHYLTEDPRVGKKYYQDRLHGSIWDKFEFPFPEILHEYINNMLSRGGPIRKQVFKDKAIKQIDNLFRDIEPLGKTYREGMKLKDKIINDEFPPRSGGIYETTVHKGKSPDQYRYIDWYEKLPEDIKKRLKTYLEKHFPDELQYVGENTNEMIPLSEYLTGGSPTVKDIYRDFPSLEYRDVSDIFRNLGVSGVKYPSGSLSGIKDSPRSNYVVFDPKEITIDKLLGWDELLKRSF